MDYENWKHLAEDANVEINDFHRTVGLSKNTVNTAAKRKGGEVPERFVYMLKGVIADNCEWYRMIRKHKSNSAVKAQLDSLMILIDELEKPEPPV